MFVVGVLGFTVFASMLAFFSYHLTGDYAERAPHLLDDWVHLLYVGVFVVLTTSTVFGFRGNEFYDVTKLFVFPVSHRVVFSATTIGLMGSASVLVFLPALVIPLVILGGGPAMMTLRFAGLLLYLFLAVSIGQLFLYALLNVLRSRRFADLLVVAGALVGGGLYTGMRFMTFGRGLPFESVIDGGLPGWLYLIPSVWITRVIGAFGAPGGSELAGLAFGAIPLAFLVVRGAARLQEAALHGAIPLRLPDAEKVRSTRAGPIRSLLRRSIPADLRALAGKEITTLRREPMVKTILIQQTVFVLVPLVFGALQTQQGRMSLLELAVHLPFALLFVEQLLLLNLLGLEGRGLSHLLALPIGRRRVLLGKNLAHVAVFGTLNAIATTIVAIVGWSLEADVGFGGFAAVLGSGLFRGGLGLIVVIALGNIFSFYAPATLTAGRRSALGQQASAREGCGIVFVRLATFLIVILMLAPVVVLLELSGWVPALRGWFDAVAVVVSVGYALGLYRGSLRLGVRVLERREQQLLARFVQSVD